MEFESECYNDNNFHACHVRSSISELKAFADQFASTSTDISTTYVLTQYQTSRSHVTLTVTPTSTVYVTERPAKLRRAPAPTEKAYLKRRSVQLDSVDAIVNAFLADNSTIPSNSSAATTAPAYQSQLFSDISSACSCHAYFWTPLYTDLVTETAPASVSSGGPQKDFTD